MSPDHILFIDGLGPKSLDHKYFRQRFIRMSFTLKHSNGSRLTIS